MEKDMYNYKEQLRKDVKEILLIDGCYDEYKSNMENISDVIELIFCDDSITGNGSGSYTFSRYEARKNVLENLDEIIEACRNYGYSDKDLLNNMYDDNYEAVDVIYRCYLLDNGVCDDIIEKWLQM